MNYNGESIGMLPGEAREVATAFKTEAGDAEKVIVNLDNLLMRLEEAWEGRSFQSFRTNFEEFKVSFRKMIPMIEDAAATLEAAARNFEEADSASAV